MSGEGKASERILRDKARDSALGSAQHDREGRGAGRQEWNESE